MAAAFLLRGPEPRLRHQAFVLGPFLGHVPSQPGELLLDGSPLGRDLLERSPLGQRDSTRFLRRFRVRPDRSLEVRGSLSAAPDLGNRHDFTRENRSGR